MDFRVIKDTADYEAALVDVERLVALDPAPDSRDAEALELLTILIEDYEKRQFPFDAPEPISAIRFRMEEQGLRQKDLVPLLGSRSRVSEVLSGERALTLPMIRSLANGLGIPADILIGGRTVDSEPKPFDNKDLNWSRFPIQEMRRRGWLTANKKHPIEDLVREFITTAVNVPAAALYRRRFHGAAITERTHYSIIAWSARVLTRAAAEAKRVGRFEPAKLTAEALRELAHLSTFEQGPRLAIEFLAQRGIVVIVEPHLPKTHLDGAAFLRDRDHAVIGLTLRFDRVDAFWFTLLHEVHHVWKHLSSVEDAFVDRLENAEPDDFREKEANRLARETFIPRAIWRRSPAFLAPSRENILQLADQLNIHPGIVVGRLHYETGNYRSFPDLLRTGTVRRQFPEARFA
ncbi:MAG: helix-turn-helix domain-containing protein [Gammaproteobacteria bacterium]|nr:helix-turn-helix domain-containing protein [Gammaproteobacteria bacterium]